MIAPSIDPLPSRRLPLRWRLPNAAPIFVGRAAESERLATMIGRAPFSLVWGLGGLGKTSLVLRHLHQRHGDRLDRVLFVSLRAPDASPQLTVEVTRALCAAEGIAAVDWTALLADEAGLVETVIDLAEKGPYWLVIDDLHHGDPHATETLVRAAMRYARNSRWIATSRIDWPLSELEGQRLALGGLDDAALAELAQRIDGQLDAVEIERLVRRAAGSPWRMRMALGSESDQVGVDILQGLSPESIELLHALVPLEVPLPRALIAQALPEIPLDAWASLERRGIVESRSSGWRLHDMARALVRDVVVGERVARYADEIGRALAASDEPAAWLEALRLAFERGDLGRACEVLRAHGDQLIDVGYTSELWRMLEPATERGLLRWRLRAGVELGTPEVLAQLRELPDPSPQERPLWGQALFAMGRMQESAEVANRAFAAARVANDAGAALDAELLFLHAQTLANLGNQNELLKMLREISAAQTEIQRAALAAKCYALMGVFEPALVQAAKILPRCTELPPGPRLIAYLDILAAYLSVGRMDDADDVLGRIASECGDVTMATYSFRYLLVLRTSVKTHLGRFAEAHEAVNRVLPFTGRSAVQRPVLVSLRYWLRLIEGDLAGIGPQIDHLNSDFARNANEYFVQWGFVLKSFFDRLHARREVPGPNAPPALTGAGGALLRIYRIVQRVRLGEALPPADRAFLDGLYPASYLWALGRTVPALVALLAGDFDTAVREASTGAHLLEEYGNHLYEAEAREVLCEALLVAHRRDDLALEAAAVSRLGAAFPSPRLTMTAELFQMAAQATPPDPAVLERMALRDATGPVVGRRARALLGGDPPLDEVDRMVVAELRRRDRIEVVAVRGQPGADVDWQPGWGLDELRKAVWLSDGRSVPLGDHPVLWAVMEAIAGCGGAASREELVPAIWPGERYDPLVHNNRLNPAIRKLRLAIEVNPSRPSRLVTTADGYGFGDAEPVRWFRRMR